MLLQLMQLNGVGIAAAVGGCAAVNSDVVQGARGVARRRPRGDRRGAPVYGGRCAAAIAYSRHVCSSRRTSARRLCGSKIATEARKSNESEDRSPEPNVPIYEAKTKVCGPSNKTRTRPKGRNAPLREAAATWAAAEAGLWMLSSSPGSSGVLQRPTKAWDGSPTGCHNPAGRYNGIPRPLVCVAAGERRKR